MESLHHRKNHMICISRDVMKEMGLRSIVADGLYTLFPETGVLPCTLFSFNGAGEGTPHGKRPSEWLAGEARPRLLLIGMSDRYGDGKRITETVQEMAVAASGLYSREPTPEEMSQLRDLILNFGWSYGEKAAALLGLY